MFVFLIRTVRNVFNSELYTGPLRSVLSSVRLSVSVLVSLFMVTSPTFKEEEHYCVRVVNVLVTEARYLINKVHINTPYNTYNRCDIFRPYWSGFCSGTSTLGILCTGLEPLP